MVEMMGQRYEALLPSETRTSIFALRQYTSG
jgi:hypothetical protein